MGKYPFALLGVILVEFILAPLGGRVFDYFFPEDRGFAGMMPEVPFYQWGYASMLALGFVGGIGIARWQDKHARTGAEGAVIELLIHGDERHAESVREENIGRWAILKSGYSVRKREAGLVTTYLHTILFATFDVAIAPPSSFRVSGRNMILPQYDIRFANERFIVVLFEGKIPPGTLVVTVQPRRKP
jgi:hypothetical protein